MVVQRSPEPGGLLPDRDVRERHELIPGRPEVDRSLAVQRHAIQYVRDAHGSSVPSGNDQMCYQGQAVPEHG